MLSAEIDLENPQSTPSSSVLDNEEKNTSNVTPTDRSNKPDCSRVKGALCVSGAFLGVFSTFGQVNSFGTFQAWYGQNQLAHRSSSAISWIGSSQLCTFFLAGWLIGRLFDAYGPRMLMLTGTSLAVLSLAATSFARTYPEFIVTHGVLFGLGSAFMFRPCVLSVPTHYSKYKATAIGVVFTGNSIGGIVFPIITRKLLESIGFENTLRVLGLICLVCCLLATAAVSSNSDHAGLGNGSLISFGDILDANFVIMAIGSALISLGVFIPSIFIVEFAYSSHLKSVPFYILSVMNGAGTLGRILPAILSDLYGRFNLIIMTTLLAGVSCLALWLPVATIATGPNDGVSSEEVILVIAFGVTYGLFSGGFVSLVNPCMLQISPRGQEGTRSGALNTFLAVPTLVGGPIGGALLATSDKQGFSYIATFCGSCLILGSLVVSCARMRLSRGKIMMKV